MITGWFLKLAISVTLVGIVLFEIGSPLLTRAQLDDRAHNAGSVAYRELRDGKSEDEATEAAKQSAGSDFRGIEFLPDGKVKLTMQTTARSIVVRKYIKALASWYDVKLDAVSLGSAHPTT